MHKLQGIRLHLLRIHLVLLLELSHSRHVLLLLLLKLQILL
jgi:hypothetical protein